MVEQAHKAMQYPMAEAEAVAVLHLMAEDQLQEVLIGQMFHQEQAILTHKQVVKVVQVNNFQRSLDMEQMYQIILMAEQPQVTLEGVVVEQAYLTQHLLVVHIVHFLKAVAVVMVGTLKMQHQL
jgi:hypothetical protein